MSAESSPRGGEWKGLPFGSAVFAGGLALTMGFLVKKGVEYFTDSSPTPQDVRDVWRPLTFAPGELDTLPTAVAEDPAVVAEAPQATPNEAA